MRREAVARQRGEAWSERHGDGGMAGLGGGRLGKEEKGTQEDGEQGDHGNRASGDTCRLIGKRGGQAACGNVPGGTLGGGNIWILVWEALIGARGSFLSMQ